MKMNIIAVTALAGLLASGVAFAQNASANTQRGQGKGHGAPPQSTEERAARRDACLERNNDTCPQGGPGLGQRKGQGNGQGKGKCLRHGLRDGTGPRSVDGTCPQGNAGQQRGRR